MKKRTLEMAPEEIRAVREQLGLSQTEAGELLGGGPRAFTKYETGTIKPSASVINLLRVLQADPAAAATLLERKSRPMAAKSGTRPFEVNGDHITVLTEQAFSPFLRRLLNAEAQAHGIPNDAIHVASSISTPDGGEDGYIAWEGDPGRTPFLPSRRNGFQLKAGKVMVAKAGREVLTEAGVVKDMVRSVLQAGGHYHMLCAQPYVRAGIEARRESILATLRKAGMAARDDQVLFRDADQIAEWANCHPAVAIWVKEQTQPGMIGPFRSWVHLAGRSEHELSPLAEDQRLPELSAHLQERMAETHGVARVVGPSGIGKTRLVLEALGPTKQGDCSLSDIVLYADASEADVPEINRVVQTWSDMGARAIVIVDRCASECHDVLARMVARSSSRLSLVTIDNEIPSGTLDKATFRLGEASASVIEAIVNGLSPSLPPEDHRRLVHFGGGFPGIAIRTAVAWAESRPVAHATDDDFVRTFVLRRSQQEADLVFKSAKLLAVFRLVPVESDDLLSRIAALGREVSVADLRSSIQTLVDRGVVQRKGGSVVLQPGPIAMKLAERQWKEWSRKEWDEVLAGDMSPVLRKQAARQLALLNNTEISPEVVAHVCRARGSFDDPGKVFDAEDAEVLVCLAEIDAATVANWIEEFLDKDEDLSDVGKNIRGRLVWAAEKIAFRPDTFEDGAQLLLRLAVAEGRQGIKGNATRKFIELFPMLAGNTGASGATRLSFLDGVVEADDPFQQLIVVEALIAGAETQQHFRLVGAETHGTRPALEDWRPETGKEATHYIKGCVMHLASFARHNVDSGFAARVGLGRHLGPLLSLGFIDIDTVGEVVRQVVSSAGQWNEALESLGHFLQYDVPQENQELIDRVNGLLADLKPQDFEARVRFLVTDMPWDFPCEEELDFEARQARQTEEVHALAVEIAKRPEILQGSLPAISQGQQRMAAVFGESMAKSVDSPKDWLERIVSAVVEAPEDKRNFELLSGYMLGMIEDHPTAVDKFKQRVARSPELAPALPLVCWRIGITASDVLLAIHSLQAGLLPPRRLVQWSFGGILSRLPTSTVAPLFDAMLDHSAEALVTAVDLMGMYVHGAVDRLDDLSPLIRKSAGNLVWSTQLPRHSMVDYHFEELMKWMLAKGRSDDEARVTALALARALVHATERNNRRLIEPLIPTLLSSFPEIVWPLIGQAIVSDTNGAWRFEHVLGKQWSTDRKEKPAILALPEDTLFAWCHAHPDHAPAFVATAIPVLETYDVDASNALLHPVMRRLLDEFGEHEKVLRAIGDNIMYNFAWRGSVAVYYELHRAPLNALSTHPKLKVRRWAKESLRQLGAMIQKARDADEEQRAQ